MTGCERLSDRMPAVALGRSTWSGDESAHLAGCAECRAEWALVQGAARMGGRLPPVRPAERTERTVAELLPRLRDARQEDRRTATRRAALRWGGLAAAAAIAFAVVLRGPAGPAAEPVIAPAAGVAFSVPLAELDLADAEELRAALDAFEAPITDGNTLERSPGVGDVEADDLERVLRAWEG